MANDLLSQLMKHHQQQQATKSFRQEVHSLKKQDVVARKAKADELRKDRAMKRAGPEQYRKHLEAKEEAARAARKARQVAFENSPEGKLKAQQDSEKSKALTERLAAQRKERMAAFMASVSGTGMQPNTFAAKPAAAPTPVPPSGDRMIDSTVKASAEQSANQSKFAGSSKNTTDKVASKVDRSHMDPEARARAEKFEAWQKSSEGQAHAKKRDTETKALEAKSAAQGKARRDAYMDSVKKGGGGGKDQKRVPKGNPTGGQWTK